MKGFALVNYEKLHIWFYMRKTLCWADRKHSHYCSYYCHL